MAIIKIFKTIIIMKIVITTLILFDFFILNNLINAKFKKQYSFDY